MNEVGDVGVVEVTGFGFYGSLLWDGWLVWCPVVCNLKMDCSCLLNLGLLCKAD